MEGNAQRLGAVDMPIGHWVGDDGVCAEAAIVVGFRLATAAPLTGVDTGTPAGTHDLNSHIEVLRHLPH